MKTHTLLYRNIRKGVVLVAHYHDEVKTNLRENSLKGAGNITQQWGIPCSATCLSIIPSCIIGPYLLLLSHAAHHDHTTHTRVTEEHSWTIDPDHCFTLKLSQKPGFQWRLKQLKDGLRQMWRKTKTFTDNWACDVVWKQGLDWDSVGKLTFSFWCLYFWYWYG